jgi:glycosyltransferase involved in cell wall biosynthesis
MRICILSPGAISSNPRVVKEAGALAEARLQVTTIAVRTLSYVDRLDEAILAHAPWRTRRLDFRSRGIGWRLRRALQIGQQAVFSLTGFDRCAERAISPFTAALTAAARTVAADLYIAHYPAALPAAAIAARMNNARYAYDAEDFHLGDWPDGPRFEHERRLVRAVEARHLKNCAYVTAASPGIADAYAKTYGIVRPTVVLNVFPRAQAPAVAPGPAGTAMPRPSIYWFSQTIGSDRGLETAIEAIGRARTKPHLYLRGNPAVGFVEKMRSIASRVGAADRLHVLAPESPLEMARLASAYDAGLSSEPGHSRNNMLALGNKLFTYLLGGIPALLSDVPAHRALAADMGRAVRLYSAESARSLADAIDALLGGPQALADARAAAFQLAQTRFNWDVEKIALLDCVRSTLAFERG